MLFFHHQSSHKQSNIHIHIKSMHKLTVLFLALALTSLFLLSRGEKQKTVPELFEEWRIKYGHTIDLSAEKIEYRLRIFEKNLKSIEEHNANPAHSYKQGVNQFTAFSQQEFQAMFLTKIQPHASSIFSEEKLKDKLNVDWVSYGAVSPVKNQGSCQASYAFSAIGGIEGISVIFYKQQQEYSVQQLIDCSQSYGNQGCTFGNMINSYQYIVAKGIQTQNAYPFTGVVGSCKTSSGLFKISGYNNVNSCNNLEIALTGRPVPVALDGQNFASYRSGIFDSCGINLSIAALLVGGTDQYYRVKLSWGTSWGEAGYIRLSRVVNICGICSAPTYPIV